MRDIEIRGALRAKLTDLHGHEAGTIIVDEFSVCEGFARVDVAVVNGLISGYEIKSDRDTLARLPSQSEAYNRTFDRMTIVVGSAHLKKVLGVVPAWWGVMRAEEHAGHVVLYDVRSECANPKLDPYAVAQLLWRDEALEILKCRGLAKGFLSKPRFVLWERLAEHVPSHELADLVRAQLKARADWRSDAVRT